MTKTLHLLITLLDDVVISTSTTTTGLHNSLDYIPGNLLLGAAAAHIYKLEDASGEKKGGFSAQQLWQLFHSGEVRFQNGWPLSSAHEVAYPMPMSLHCFKGSEKEITEKDSNQLKPDALFVPQPQAADTSGHSKKDKDKKRQPKQMRGGYLTASGELIKPSMNASLKTAINPDTGRAATSQLFGYQSLQAEQRFLATLDLPDSIAADIENQLRMLFDNQVHRLGRARSAQYGRARIQIVAGAVAHNFSQNDLLPNNSELTLWCLSDLALTDPVTAQPTLQPTPAHFGLSGGELDLQRSFIRTHSYSPFNGHRKAFDSRREVITKGSVLHFSGLDGLSDENIKRLKRPFGSYSEAGLGVVLAQPDLLQNGTIQLAAPTPQSAIAASGKGSKQTGDKAAESFNPDESDLILWLRTQINEQPESLDRWLANRLTEIKAIYQEARTFNGISPDIEVGPSASQWGEVYQTARNHRFDEENLFKSLFADMHDKNSNAVCRKRAGSEFSWELELPGGTPFAAWFRDLIKNERTRSHNEQPATDTRFSEKVALLASDMRGPKGQKVSRFVQEDSHA